MKFAAVFPGQGSQSVGMLSELASQYGCVQQTFAEASDVLGYDLWQLIQEGPEEKLKITAFTQPAMFVSGVAVLRVWREAGGIEPAMVAGHSLGEYTALVAAGSMSFADATSVVATRAQLMNDAVPAGVGGMAAVIGMDDDAVVALCQELTGERIVEAVNFNAPGQVVISGHLDALEGAVAQAKEKGARMATLLPVSVPNHSSLMQSVVAPLEEKIRSVAFAAPAVPVVQNLEATAYGDTAPMLDALCQHVASPVYWTKTVQNMKAAGVEAVVEMGPGKVLTGLAKRIDRKLASAFVADEASLEKALSLTSA